MSDPSILDDLSRFDGEYVAQASFLPGLETVPDGQHDFEVVSAELGRTKNTGDPILRVNLRVGGGLLVEWGTPLTSQEACNRLGADLCVLGFDADRWRGARKFSDELGKVVPKLKGLRFRGLKRTETSRDGKTYHKLLPVCRVQAGAGTNGAARTPPPAPPTQQARQAPPPRQTVPPDMGSGDGGSDIPF